MIHLPAKRKRAKQQVISSDDDSSSEPLVEAPQIRMRKVNGQRALETQQRPSQQGWQCQRCTFLNHTSKNACEVCESLRTTPEVRPPARNRSACLDFVVPAPVTKSNGSAPRGGLQFCPVKKPESRKPSALPLREQQSLPLQRGRRAAATKHKVVFTSCCSGEQLIGDLRAKVGINC